MGKIAFVFPGQGAQSKGMAKELIDGHSEYKEQFDAMNQQLDFDLYDIMYGESNLLDQTSYTQPALVCASTLLHRAFVTNTGIKPDYVAGLSLGEYSALACAGFLEPEDAVRLVRQRGLFMEEAGKATPGAMSAVLRADQEQVEQILEETEGMVVVANYNSKVQLVLSGEEKAVQEAGARLVEASAKVIPLNVSGAFHSPLMESASMKLEKELQETETHELLVPYVPNVDAIIRHDSSETKKLLTQQVTGSVRWKESIETLIDEGVDTFYEIGPGKTLAGLIKKINRKVKVVNIDSMEAIQQMMAKA